MEPRDAERVQRYPQPGQEEAEAWTPSHSPWSGGPRNYSLRGIHTSQAKAALLCFASALLKSFSGLCRGVDPPYSGFFTFASLLQSWCGEAEQTEGTWYSSPTKTSPAMPQHQKHNINLLKTTNKFLVILFFVYFSKISLNTVSYFLSLPGQDLLTRALMFYVPQLLNHECNFKNNRKAKLFLEVVSRSWTEGLSQGSKGTAD